MMGGNHPLFLARRRSLPARKAQVPFGRIECARSLLLRRYWGCCWSRPALPAPTPCRVDANRQWQSALLYGFVHTLAAVVAAMHAIPQPPATRQRLGIHPECRDVLRHPDREDHAGRHPRRANAVRQPDLP
jgi:hypothetical protein